jgi:hypothetical protein
MHLFSWLHQRMTGRPHTQRAPTRTQTWGFRPRLEALEDREMPSFS